MAAASSELRALSARSLSVKAVEDYEDDVALPGQGPGRARLKQRVATIRAAFQPRQRLYDVIVDADRVAVRWTLWGTRSGRFLSLPATRKQVEFDGVDIYAMRHGRMAAHWNVVDMWAFYQQAAGCATLRGSRSATATTCRRRLSRSSSPPALKLRATVTVRTSLCPKGTSAGRFRA